MHDPLGKIRRRVPALIVLAALLASCDGPADESGRRRFVEARPGVDPVPEVHLFENHASALLAWRRARVQDRILVHLDHQPAIDWLPDETIARIAVASPAELPELTLHPYAMDGSTLRRFSSRNFLYPAVRLGMVREIVWVVPDGSFRELEEDVRLVSEVLVGRMQAVSPEEANSLRWEGGRLVGTLLDIPITVCEIADLPDFREPVLLDVDLGFFTNRSLVRRQVSSSPWIGPDDLLRALAERDLRTDLVTISTSTMGGFAPPESRWVGRVLRDRLRDPEAPLGASAEERDRALGAPTLEHSLERFRELTRQYPDDPTLWYSLARSLVAAGQGDEASSAWRRAVSLDPVLEHALLFEADRFWINGGYGVALNLYRQYSERYPNGPFTAYALRRQGSCLARMNRAEPALALLREVVNRAPNHGDSHLELGLLLRDRGELEEAAKHFKIARSLLPEMGTYALALGTTYLRMGRQREGLDELHAAVERRPCWALARLNLAAALTRLGRYAEAGEHVRAAMSLQPKNVQVQILARELRRHGVRVTEVSLRF